MSQFNNSGSITSPSAPLCAHSRRANLAWLCPVCLRAAEVVKRCDGGAAALAGARRLSLIIAHFRASGACYLGSACPQCSRLLVAPPHCLRGIVLLLKPLQLTDENQLHGAPVDVLIRYGICKFRATEGLERCNYIVCGPALQSTG